MIESFPLQWPAGYPRTARPASNFRFYPSTLAGEIKRLKDELYRMNARAIVISTNIPVKNDGNPYSTYSKPADTAVAVYFTVDNKAMALCCDKWNTVEANLRALVMSVDAMRGLDRLGVSEIMNRAFMGFKVLPEKAASFPWWEVLGEATEAYRNEYAKSQCIAFAEWIRANDYQYDDVKDCYEYYDSNAAGSYGLKFICKTTDELYTLFLNQK